MRVVAQKRLREYGDKKPAAKPALDSWYHEASRADWKKPTDIKKQYRSASILKKNRVVFNIAGNKYRLIVRIDYKSGIIFIRFIGTHTEYDNVDAEEV